MKTKLTKRVVDAAQPGARDSFIWDVDVPGFGFKLTPAGKRVYVLQYRMGGRKSPWRYTIGQHGEYTVDGARTEATRLRGLIADGMNPAVEKAAAREKGMLMRDLVERFLEEHVRARRKQRTSSEYERLCRDFIVRPLGNVPVREVIPTSTSAIATVDPAISAIDIIKTPRNRTITLFPTSNSDKHWLAQSLNTYLETCRSRNIANGWQSITENGLQISLNTI